MSVYAAAINGKVFHYKDDSGLEADMVVQLDSGAWAAFEVKLRTFPAKNSDPANIEISLI